MELTASAMLPPRTLHGAHPHRTMHPAISLSRSRDRCGTNALSSPGSPQLQAGSTLWRDLAHWVEAEGGYIHPALAIVDEAPCGTRGVISREAIAADPTQPPLIIVPERLYMTSKAARQFLTTSVQRSQPAASTHGVQHQPRQLSSLAALALFLAHERQKGPTSFWAPYIDGLPPQPPSAWALSEVTLAMELQKTTDLLVDAAAASRNVPVAISSLLQSGMPRVTKQGQRTATFGHTAALTMSSSQAAPSSTGSASAAKPVLLEMWRQNVEHARAAMHLLAQQAVDAGQHAGMEVQHHEVMWALAQVVSRSFGCEANLGLAPYIDSCNHYYRAAKPDGFEMDGEVFMCVRCFEDQQLQPMCPGQELYIAYPTAQCSPLNSFLSFGFVPAELLPT